MTRLTVTIHYEKFKPVLHPEPESESILVRHVLVDGERQLFEHKHGADNWIVLDADNNRLRLVLEPQPCPTCGETKR